MLGVSRHFKRLNKPLLKQNILFIVFRVNSLCKLFETSYINYLSANQIRKIHLFVDNAVGRVTTGGQQQQQQKL